MKRSALITGASSGIGEAIALALANHDTKLFLTGRSEERLKQVATETENKGATVLWKTADVTRRDEVEKVIELAISEFKSIDILIANAGVGRFKNLEEFTDEDFEIQFDTNVKGVFFFLRPIIKHMREQNNGQIVVTSSNLGFETYARCGIYAATKHAIQAMIGALREELKGSNVKAATINPGSVDTPWYDGKDVERNKMLTAKNVADATMLIINQGERSDIDHILLHPGKS